MKLSVPLKNQEKTSRSGKKDNVWALDGMVDTAINVMPAETEISSIVKMPKSRDCISTAVMPNTSAPESALAAIPDSLDSAEAALRWYYYL